jgi:hypothetical protein
MSRNLMVLCGLCGLLLVTASACRKGADANTPAATPAPTTKPAPPAPTRPAPSASTRPAAPTATTLPATPAPGDAASKEAETLLEKIMALITDGKLDDAGKMLTDLKAKSATLPQSIQDKIKAADAALAAKKAVGGVTVPKMPG